MKKVLSVILSLALLITTLTVSFSFAGVSAEEQKINRLLAFGDSIVFGDGRIQNPMNDQKCGDQQFANLIAQEYALPYIKDNSDTTTSGRWYRKYAHNGAIMKNEEYLNPTYGSILNQVTNCPTDVIAAADTIVMDGGINDVGKAIGINFSNKGYPQGCTDEMYPQGVKTDIQGFTLSEMETFVDTLKNMTETDSSYYTWQTIKKNIVDGYKEVMDTLLEKDFNGTIYMQNNINPFTEGKDNENSDKMVYYWDSMINYFITDSIRQTIEAYPDVDIKLVDLCKELRHGTTYTGHGYSWDSPDNLHLSFAGNQAVYKYYSTFIDSNANTLDVGLDTIPSDASWRVLTTFDDSTQNVENGELVKINDVIGVVSSGVVAEENLLKVNGTTAVFDLSGFDLSNIYGIRVRFANAKDGGYSNVIFSTDNKQLYWNHGNSKSLDYVGVSSNEICGIKSSPYLTTIGRNPDFKKLENLTISSGVSDDAIYIDDIEVFTNDTSLPTPELRTVISSESEVAYENFYMTYDPNTDNAIHVGSVGSESFCNHAIKYQGGNNNFLRLQTKSQLFTNPGGFTDLKIIWGSYPAYDLTSGTYKLVAFVVPSGTSGTFSFTQCEDGNAYSSGAVLINSVDFSTATPIATYDNGAAKAYEIGEFTIVNGDTDKTLIKFDRVSDGAQLMLHGLAAVPADSDYPTTTTTTTSSSTTTTTTTTTTTATDKKTVNVLKGGVWQDGDLVYTTGINYDSAVKEGNRVIYTDGTDRPETGNNGLMIPVDASKTYTLSVTGNSIPSDICVRYYQYKADKTPNMFRASGSRNFSQSVAGQKTATLTTGSGESLNNYLHSNTAYIIVMLFKSNDGGATTANKGIKVSDMESNINVQITYEREVEPLTVSATMTDGASIRLNDVNGIRFYTKVDIEKVASLRNAGYTVELGTLIAPVDNIQDKELSFDLETGKYVDVKFNSATYYTEGDFSGIVGSLVNIKDTNITRDFVGRGYVKVSDTEGNETITYADYASNNVANNTRSLQTVATALKNDTSDSAQTLYQNHKAMVDAWAEGKAYTK